ncbi:hypothetical protein NE237_013301 [Protea cynaroides]|uniref:GAG-pre-integrase domain-containing protein n=1 Tax=Protea cynaroides TaxID=273540 RepID=A0A9Q0GZ25_9MAGN|nr:hypothetical protein NE237_013301 [Protea cynaroides]
MTGDERKFVSKDDYKGKRFVFIANNAKLPIAHVSSLVLQDVFHVPNMKKNLISVSQLTKSGGYVIFGPDVVMVYETVHITGYPYMQGRRCDSIYVMIAQEAYVDRTRQHETTDLWHARLAHVGFTKLKVMMQRKLVRGLLELEVRSDTVCSGCQYGKAHQLPYVESKFQAKMPLELVHLHVFGKVATKSIGGDNGGSLIEDEGPRRSKCVPKPNPRRNKHSTCQCRSSFSHEEARRATSFLGLELEQDDQGIFLGQQKYAKDLLVCFGMSKSNISISPMEVNAKLCTDEEEDVKDPIRFKDLLRVLDKGFALRGSVEVHRQLHPVDQEIHCEEEA